MVSKMWWSVGLQVMLLAVGFLSVTGEPGASVNQERSLKSSMKPFKRQILDIPCNYSHDCSGESSCQQGTCVCRPYYVAWEQKSCLPASLLGFNCKVDDQCQLKVEGSECRKGKCRCRKGLIQHKLHLCLQEAKIGDFCFLDEQCQAADSGSYCKFIIPRVYGKCQCTLGSKKGTDRTVCLGSPEAKATEEPVTLGKSCNNSRQCRASDPNSLCVDGYCDCIIQNGVCSAEKNGCFKDTFQCRTSGKCISWYYVCNGIPDCPDGSDEGECTKNNCPDVAFTCSDGTCLSRAKVCDGNPDCPNDISDELGCRNSTAFLKCPRGSFRCNSGECVPQYAYCNSKLDCQDNSDEGDTCDLGSSRNNCPFRCSNGRCRSTAILCSGMDGCGDNSDENKCRICSCPNT